MSGCSWPLTDQHESELTVAVVKAHLDTLNAWFIRADRPAEYRRAILLQGSTVTETVADAIRKDLKIPYLAIRTDSSEIDYTYGSARNSEGKEFQYTDTVRDRETGLPVLTIYVDSIRGTAPGRATLHLYEADVEGTHYQGLQWWFHRSGGAWLPDSVHMLWIN